MRLAEYTDYTLRVLMHCAANPQRLVTVREIADLHGVSRNHLMKIVNDLSRQGLLATTRGRGGGMRLVRPPAEVRIGDLIRRSETDFRLVECFDPASNACGLSASCRLRVLLDRALQAYFRELDAATLEDMVRATAASGAGAAASPVVRVPLDTLARKRA